LIQVKHLLSQTNKENKYLTFFLPKQFISFKF